MNPEIQEPVPEPQSTQYTVPWKPVDNWIGVALIVLIDAALLVTVWLGISAQFVQSMGVILLELVYIIPVLLIFAWRHIQLKQLGFRRFQWSELGLGCGLLIGSYMLVLLHNGILTYLGVDTQGEEVMKIFTSLNSPIWFMLAAVIVAPVVEEMFFRGFLFQGFRQRYGWVAASMLSSAIFAAAHLDPVSLIPTFILGVVFSYVYHRSNSVWPGIILHFSVNAFGVTAIYAAHLMQNFIPS